LDVDEVTHGRWRTSIFFFAAQETDSRFDRPSGASLNEQASPNDHYIVIKNDHYIGHYLARHGDNRCLTLAATLCQKQRQQAYILAKET